MTSGDCLAMCLGRENGIEHWRSLIGPTKVSEAKKSAPKSIRSIFGNPSNEMKNAVHGSDSPVAAGREIDLIFPNIIADSEGINFSENNHECTLQDYSPHCEQNHFYYLSPNL